MMTCCKPMSLTNQIQLAQKPWHLVLNIKDQFPSLTHCCSQPPYFISIYYPNAYAVTVLIKIASQLILQQPLGEKFQLVLFYSLYLMLHLLWILMKLLMYNSAQHVSLIHPIVCTCHICSLHEQLVVFFDACSLPLEYSPTLSYLLVSALRQGNSLTEEMPKLEIGKDSSTITLQSFTIGHLISHQWKVSKIFLSQLSLSIYSQTLTEPKS